MSDLETWLPVVGYEGYYEVSSLGRVRSLDRELRNRQGSFIKQGQILKPFPASNGPHPYPVVDLRAPGRKRKVARVHRLVCEAFHGPAPEGKPLALHKNGNPLNPEASNIYWGDEADNTRDAKLHGTYKAPEERTHCKKMGHELIVGKTWKQCLECSAERKRENIHLGLDESDPRHGTVRGYWAGCRLNCCKAASHQYFLSRKDTK